MTRSNRSQEDHPLVDAGHVLSASDHVLRLIHLKAYADAAVQCAGRTVLDVGCNDGYGTVILAPGARSVAGVDVSSHAIESARRRPGAEAIDFRVVGGAGLPFPDESFDVVTAFQVIEHVPDPRSFIAELRRIVRVGGVVLITTPNAAIRLDPGMTPWNPYHVREFTADELRSELASTFEDVDVRGLFGPPAVASIELARSAAARRRARRRRPRIVQRAIELVPDSIRLRVRSRRNRPGAADRAAILAVDVTDLWLAAENLELALDLHAACSRTS
jgi:SAM-dependent methyltransferase